MSVRVALTGAALLLLGVACDALPEVMPGREVECGDTEAALCDAVVRLAVAEMNVTATGPITHVTLTSGDCARLATSTFQGGMRTADRCWGVEVTGERSHGAGFVALQPDGTFDTYWP